MIKQDELMFGDDQQAFLYAQAREYLREGKPLTKEHEEALKAEHRNRFTDINFNEQPF